MTRPAIRSTLRVWLLPVALLTLMPPAFSQSAPAPPSDSPGQLPPGWAAAAAAARKNNPTTKPARFQPTPAVAFPGTHPSGAGTPAAFARTATPPAASESGGVAPADLPADPARITFQAGLLTIHATNSSLAQILADTAIQTGMTLEGTPEEERVFGDFGPAPVDKVLGQLLDGGSSNYLLFGLNQNQAPRSLVITPRASLAPGAVLAAAAAVPVAVTNDDDDDDDAPAPQAPLRPLQPIQPIQPMHEMGPGQPVRTPQQILDDMQRRRQEQQNNSQNAPD